MTSRRPRHMTDDRGVSALLFGLMLTALLAISAFAVDIGAAYNERRHDQNTADVAAVSGAVEAVLGGGIIDEVVKEVRLKVDTTLGHALPDSEWEGCVDDEALHYTTRELASANPVIATVSDCISFSRTFEEVRVKIPDQDPIRVFGPALGFGDIKVSAAANAKIESATGGLPFVALATATKGDFVCLRTTSAKEPLPLANGNGPGVPSSYPASSDTSARPDPCNTTEFDTASENFGTLKPWRYETCTQQNTDVETAIAIGLDHPMGIFALGYYEVPPVPEGHKHWKDYQPRYDGAPFNSADGTAGCRTAFPNTFELDEGLNAGGLSCSLLRNAGDTCNGVTPRLQSGDYSITHTFSVLGINKFDNTSPWDFLRPADKLWKEGFPDSCVVVAASAQSGFDPYDDGGIESFPFPTAWDANGNPTAYNDVLLNGLDDAAWSDYDRYDVLVQCLKEWGAETAPSSGVYYPEKQLFTKEIGRSARFGFVPQVAEESLASIDYVHIEGFLPIFMYRVYMQESGDMCDPDDARDGSGLKVHDGGQEWDCVAPSKTIDRLASIILACGMVDDTLCNKGTGYPEYAGKDIYEFRLVK